MPHTPFDLPSAIAFALLFGVKHGFDADHLATIDGLARLQAGRGRRVLARLSGALFSLGHGAMVLAAAALLQRYGIERLPDWLDPIGAWISIGFLSLIGAANLRAALGRRDGAARVSPLARAVLRLPLPSGIGASLCVGALFALSLDTMTVAAWFGLAGGRLGGAASTLLLALAFVAGMIATDSVNGLAVAYLIGKSERFAERAGRLFSLLVASSALLVAGLGVARCSSDIVDAWADGKQLMFGALIVCITVAGFLVARRQSRVALGAT
jgi:high-affinity nickel-transport protein